MEYLELTKCRLCNGDFSSGKLELASTPPANELYESQVSAKNCERFPLVLVLCNKCKHLQLKYIVSPDRLFSNYVYKSGTSAVFREHFNNLAALIASEVPAGSRVLEIGSNDGKLLEYLQKKGLDAFGLEPSEGLVSESKSNGLSVYQGFLTNDFVRLFRQEHGDANVIVANNVFAHIADMNQAMIDIGNLLDPEGVFIFEVAHLLSLVKNGYFDTIYHEHMSYHSIFSLEQFLKSHGFGVYRVQEINTHGGSIRVFAKRLPVTSPYENEIRQLVAKEESYGINTNRVLNLIDEKIQLLTSLTSEFCSTLTGNEFLFGYGAPAKVVTFLSEMNLENLDIRAVVDDNPDKQDKYLPGSGFPILNLETVQRLILEAEGPIVCFIFPWNLGEELIIKLTQFMPVGSRAISFFPNLSIKEF
jgi:SAM-dependent methyltransferase